MKETVKYLNYSKDNFPMAKRVEDEINNSGSISEQLATLIGWMSEEGMKLFLTGCILQWAQAEYFDERNRFAVFASRVIAGHFPQLKKTKLGDAVEKECYGFTHYAHRYLQNEFFKVGMKFLKNTGHMGIEQWYTSQEFVYNRAYNGLMPYSEYLLGN